MIYSYPLTATPHEEELPPVVIFTDTETRDVGEGQQALELGCYEIWAVDEMGRKAGLLAKGEYYEEETFYGLLSDYAPARVVAHNWDFDASVLRLGSSDNMEKYGYSIDVESSIIPTAGQGFAPFLLVCRFGENRVDFICNTNFHRRSLQDIGESIGVAKTVMPSVNDRAALIAYCRQDVAVLRESWFLLFDFISGFGTTPGFTLAMCAMRVFRAAFFDDEHIVQGSEHIPAIAEAEREAYHGGRTDTFFKGTPTAEWIYRYDVNSLYPSVMLERIPIRYEGRVSMERLEDREYIHLIQAEIDIPDTPIGDLGLEGVMLDGKLVFPRGRFVTWMWQPLYELARDMGWVAKAHKAYCYSTAPIFVDYVETLYSRRLKYRQEKNDAFDYMCKILMNSLYGKFGQRKMSQWEKVTDADEKRVLSYFGERFKAMWTEEQGEADYWQVGDELYRMIPEIGGLAASSVCSVAGYITARGRAEVWKALRYIRANGGNVYMCDTDSIVTDMPLPDSMVSDSRLGKWKLESRVAGADCVFVAPKHYRMERWKIKGIREPSAAPTHTQSQFPRFRTDLASANPERRKRLKTGAIIKEITKRPTGLNTKRIERGEGRFTKAIELRLDKSTNVDIDLQSVIGKIEAARKLNKGKARKWQDSSNRLNRISSS